MSEPVTSALAASAAASAATAVSPGFFAGIGMFLTGIVAGWGIIILAVLVVLGILFEHNGARGWAVFSALLLAAVAYMFFSVSLMTIAIGSVVYVLVGLLWSFWRYKRHAQKVVEKYKGEDAKLRESALRSLHPKEMLGTITAWIMIWPFSMFENIAGDIINIVQSLVTKFFRGIYFRIYDSAVAALK